MWGKVLGIILTAFLLGWTTHILVGEVQSAPLEAPRASVPSTLTLERASPSDYVQEKDIHVLSDKVVIDIQDAQWAMFTDTNSMDPLLDESSHAIQRVPSSSDDIHVGDVISYAPFNNELIVIHRVVEVGNDGSWYAITKGDNNPYNDPQKVRFEQIKRVLVAVIY